LTAPPRPAPGTPKCLSRRSAGRFGFARWRFALAAVLGLAVCGLLGLWAARAESPLRVAAIAGALAAIVGLGFDLIGQQAYIGMATDQGPVRLGLEYPP